MFLNRNILLQVVIFLVIICMSHELPQTDKLEVDESDIERVIAEKEAQEKETKKSAEQENQDIIDKRIDLYNSTYFKNDTFNEKKYDEDTSERIQQLEKQKGKLYKQINKAIDESVLLLEYTNETEAKLGINFMGDLKNQLKEINGTDLNLDVKLANDSATDLRRYNKQKITLSYIEIQNLFQKKNKDTTKHLELNDMVVAKKIDDWILQRRLEKQKIKDYKWRNKGQKEKCPREGLSKKKMKDPETGKKRARRMPCCRKCCKKSYLGCL